MLHQIQYVLKSGHENKHEFSGMSSTRGCSGECAYVGQKLKTEGFLQDTGQRLEDATKTDIEKPCL